MSLPAILVSSKLLQTLMGVQDSVSEASSGYELSKMCDRWSVSIYSPLIRLDIKYWDCGLVEHSTRSSSTVCEVCGIIAIESPSVAAASIYNLNCHTLKLVNNFVCHSNWTARSDLSTKRMLEGKSVNFCCSQHLYKRSSTQIFENHNLRPL